MGALTYLQLNLSDNTSSPEFTNKEETDPQEKGELDFSATGQLGAVTVFENTVYNFVSQFEFKDMLGDVVREYNPYNLDDPPVLDVVINPGE